MPIWYFYCARIIKQFLNKAILTKRGSVACMTAKIKFVISKLGLLINDDCFVFDASVNVFVIVCMPVNMAHFTCEIFAIFV